MEPDVLRSRELLSTTLHSLGNTAKAFARGMEDGTTLIKGHESARDNFLTAFGQYEERVRMVEVLLENISNASAGEGLNKKQILAAVDQARTNLAELLRQGLVLTESRQA